MGIHGGIGTTKFKTFESTKHVQDYARIFINLCVELCMCMCVCAQAHATKE